jgi:hypothetical protein
MLKGTSDWLEQPGTTRGWKASIGAFEQSSWEGPTSSLSTFIASLAGGFSEIDMVTDGELTEVTVRWARESVEGIGNVNEDGLIEDSWGLDGNDLEKTLWEHPKVQSILLEMSYEEIFNLRQFVDEMLTNGVFASHPEADINELIQRLVTGVDAFPVSQYVLRHTRVVTRQSVLAPNYANVLQIHSYSQLIAAEPTLASANLVDAAELETGWSWLKKTPTVRPVSRGLWELEQEYWGANYWDEWIFDPVT